MSVSDDLRQFNEMKDSLNKGEISFDVETIEYVVQGRVALAHISDRVVKLLGLFCSEKELRPLCDIELNNLVRELEGIRKSLNTARNSFVIANSRSRRSQTAIASSLDLDDTSKGGKGEHRDMQRAKMNRLRRAKPAKG